MIRMVARPVAWLLLLALLYVTIAPIEMRPITGESPNLERLVAFTALGFAFAFAYPRRWWLVLFLVIGVAFASEFAQVLSPTRHAHLKDALYKAGGGSIGVVIGFMVNRLLARVLPP